MALSKQDEVIETLVVDGLHKALGLRIQVRTFRRKPERFHTALLEELAKGVGEQNRALALILRLSADSGSSKMPCKHATMEPLRVFGRYGQLLRCLQYHLDREVTRSWRAT